MNEKCWPSNLRGVLGPGFRDGFNYESSVEKVECRYVPEDSCAKVRSAWLEIQGPLKKATLKDAGMPIPEDYTLIPNMLPRQLVTNETSGQRVWWSIVDDESAFESSKSRQYWLLRLLVIIPFHQDGSNFDRCRYITLLSEPPSVRSPSVSIVS
jgi:hypothetical protein